MPCRFWTGVGKPSVVIGVSAAAAQAAKVFQDFGVEDGRADLVDAHGPLAEIDFAAAIQQKGKSSSVKRTNMPQVGQRRSFADFFFAGIAVLAASGQQSRIMVARGGG